MANPYLVGSATGAGGTSLTIPVATPTSAGDDLVVIYGASSGATISNITDTKSNSYSLKQSDVGGLGPVGSYYVADGATTALTTSDSVVITFGGLGVANYSGIVAGVPGLITTAFDVAANADSSSSTSISVTSPTLTQASEVIIAAISSGDAGGTITWGVGWTQIDQRHATSSPHISLAYQVVNSTSPVTATATIPTAAKWVAYVGTFKVSTSVTVQTLSLPSGNQGSAYPSTTLTAAGGSGSYTWSVISGSIPAGMSLSSGGVLSGTPSASGTFSPTIQASDGTNTGSKAFTFTINPPITANVPYLAGTASAASGGSATLTITLSANVATGDNVTVGVICNTAGVTPAVGPDSQDNNYALRGSDTVNAGSQLFIFEADGVNALSSGIDSIPVTYSANTSVQGAIAVGDNSVNGHDKFVIAHGTSAAPSTGGSGALGQAEENVIAFIADANAGGVPSWSSPFSSHVIANVTGGSATRLSAAYTTVTSSSSISAGATITSAAWAAGLITHPINPVAPAIVLSGGVQGEAYSQTLEVAGGVAPYTWVVTGLPPGITQSGNVISGTPTTFGTFNVTTTAFDINGTSGTLTQAVLILRAAPGLAVPLTLANNILTQADSIFSSAGTWVSNSNASSVAISSQISVSGTSSLKWSATADGLTAVRTGSYNCVPGQPYIISGFILPPGSRDCQVSLRWLTAGGTLIQQDDGPVNTSQVMAWQPLQMAGVAPATAGKVRVVVTVQEANAGDVIHIDLMYLAQDNVQVLIDWINPVFVTANLNQTGISKTAAGSDFMDVSPYVRMDQGISITRGRRDSVSEIQPASVSFTLQNDSGALSRDKSTSIISVLGGSMTLQRRFQVNVCDELGVWHTRADGTVAQADATWDGTGNTSQIPMSGTDVLAGLSRQESLDCWAEEVAVNDQPLYHWCLTDSGNAGGAGVLAETSGNAGPPMRTQNSDNTPTAPNPAVIAFQDTSGGVETLADAEAPGAPDGSQYWSAGSNQPSSPLRGLDSGVAGPYTTPEGTVTFTPRLVSQSAANQFIGNLGYEILAQVPVLDPTQSSYSFECWFTVDPAVRAAAAASYGPYIVMSLGSARTGQTLVAGIFLTGGTPFAFHIDSYTQPPAFLGQNWPGTAPPSAAQSMSMTFAADTVRLPHHLVITITQDPAAPVVTGYLDGVQFATQFNLTASQVYDTFVLGGAYGGMGCWYGNIQHCSIYDYVLTSSQITTHCQMGQYGMWEETTDDCIAQVAAFSSVPPFWNSLQGRHAGLTMAEYQSIAGSNPLSAMQVFEKAEAGLLFTDAAGQLNFHTRDWREGHGPPDLYLPPDTFSPDMGYQLTDQFMVNEMAVSTQIFQSGTSQVNLESRDQYGLYSTSTAASPTEMPLITWSRAFGQLGLPSYNYFSDPNLDDRAAWEVNSHAEPWFLPANVTVQTLTLDKAATGIGLSDLYNLEIDDVIAPNGTLPSSFPDDTLSLEWFVEGISELISSNDRNIQFYCSPAATQRAWIPGDPVYGALGSTARIGISAADTSPVQADGKDVAHDAGRPYWPPVFGAGMNSPAGINNGFIGARDIRGLTDNLKLMLQPPMLCVGTSAKTQTMPNGQNSTPQIFWDNIFADTVGGMGRIAGWPNWYVCLVPGFYDVDASLVWGQSGSAGGTTAQGWIVVAMQAAQAVAAGTGTPVTVSNYVCPVGEQVRVNAVNMNMVNTPSTRIYLGLGDMITLAGEQTTGSSKNTGTSYGGSRMSLIWRGYAKQDDRVMLSSSITGGTVAPIHTSVTHTKTYTNTHTYSYLSQSAKKSNSRFNTDGPVWQGMYPGDYYVYGIQWSQVVFKSSPIHNDLNPGTGTVKINYCTLSCTNQKAWYKTGAKLMLGWSTQTPGSATMDARSILNRDVFEESFAVGATKTFTIPNSFAKAYQQSDFANMVVVGDGQNQDLNYYGSWLGGPGNWTLTINYTVTT